MLDKHGRMQNLSDKRTDQCCREMMTYLRREGGSSLGTLREVFTGEYPTEILDAALYRVSL